MSRKAKTRRHKRNRKTLRDKAKFAKDHHGQRSGDDLSIDKSSRGRSRIERSGPLTATVKQNRKAGIP